MLVIVKFDRGNYSKNGRRSQTASDRDRHNTAASGSDTHNDSDGDHA